MARGSGIIARSTHRIIWREASNCIPQANQNLSCGRRRRRLFLCEKVRRKTQGIKPRIMPYVELYKLQNNGSQKVVAVCRLKDDVVHCEGDTVLVSNLMIGGIKDYDRPER